VVELNEIFRILWARRLATAIVVALAIAAAAAVKLSAHSVSTGAATLQILVDSPSSELANLSQDPAPLISRAAVFAQVMTSDAVLREIAKSAGVAPQQLTAQGPYSGSGQVLNAITPAEARSSQLVAEKAPYRLTFLAQQDQPVITVSVQGPTALEAARVADAVYTGVENYVTTAQQAGGTPAQHKVTLRALGPAQAGTVNNGSRSTLMAAALLGVLLLGLLLIVGVESLRRRNRELAGIEDHLAGEFDTVTRDPRARRPASAVGERQK
jgi:capsular polysaccharide biosynthesis protein